MNQRLLVSQIVNVIGITNFLVILMLQNKLAAMVTRFSLMFSGTLIIVSFIMIVIFSALFLRKTGKNFQKCSSDLSPIFRYFLSNFAVSAVLVLFMLGFFIDTEILKVCLLSLIIFIFPIIAYNKSVYVLLHGKEIRLYDYSDGFESISGNQIKDIKKVLLGMMYKIKYEDADGSSKARYFFPNGNFFFFFSEPASIKALKSVM
jgi:hypothetical protein